MSNLLDKASIILTPTAYNNGEALCVKPSDGSGDFDFSRNSAATRVNAQGLVENVQILSSNLVQNGDFSEEGVQEVSNGSFSQEGVEQVINGSFDTDSNWLKGAGWSISEGRAISTAVGASEIYQSGGIVASKYYLFTYEITAYTSGSVVSRLFTGTSGTPRSAVGVYQEIIYSVSSNGNLGFITGAEGFVGSIDNVSVREVGQDWDFVSTSELTEQGARIYTPDGSYTIVVQNNVLVVGKQYKVTFDVIATDGSSLSNGSGSVVYDTSTIGSKVFYITTDEAGFALKRISGITDVTITNISVKEVGMDWELGNTTIGNDLVLLDADSGNAQITQSNLGSTISTAKLITFTTISSSDEVSQILRVLQNIAGTSINIYTDDNGVNLSAIGVHKVTIPKDTSANDTLKFRLNSGANRIVSLSNISVIEITDDTNLPRISYEGFSYDGSGNIIPNSGCGSWLWEPQSTNLLPYSEDFSGYIKSGINIVSNIATSPDGTVNATSLTNTTTGQSHIRTSFVAASTGNYTGTSYIKKQDFDFIYVEFGNAFCWFNISNGTLGNSGNFGSGWTFISHSIESVGNDWYRFSITANNTITGTYNFRPYQPTSANGSYTSGSLGNSFIWGAQVEQQSYATSYIPTNGEANGVTRNQDVCNNGGSLATINSTEGTLYFEGSAINNDSTNKRISLSDSSSANRIILTFANNTINYRFVSGGLLSANIVYNSDTTINKKYAITWKLNEFKFWVNGIEVGIDTSGAVFPLNTLYEFNFADYIATTLPFLGKTKALAVWKEALTDAELTELTTI